MKNLKYLLCCTCSSSSISEASPEADNSMSLDLVLQPESKHYRNRRKCNVTSWKSGSATADWRPSLKAISEDQDNINVAVNRSISSGSERTLKRKVSPMHKSKLPPRHSDDYGSAAIPGIIPAFAPTPFLF